MKTTPLYELKKIQTDFPKVKITNSKISADFIKQFYNNDIEIFESFFVLLLNQANLTIGYAKISQGGITGTVVDVRLIAKYTVDSLATQVIIAHNHPTGNLLPSQADIEITKKIKQTLNIFDVNLLDHLILTADSYYSFADEGKI
jgi:DNA repair protein RadC